MRVINQIIVHCSATKAEWMEGATVQAKVAEIKRWHTVDRGWSDIGYHYLIDRNGFVAAGRPLDKVGAHVKGHNTGSVGICLIGGHGSAATDKFSDHFTNAQDKSLRRLIGQLKADYGIVAVTGHNRYAAKACPGFRVPDWLDGKPPVDADAPATNPLAAIFAAIGKALALLFKGAKK